MTVQTLPRPTLPGAGAPASVSSVPLAAADLGDGPTAWLPISEAERSGTWVDAHPFRVYLRHLMSCSGLSWRTIAVVAGVSPNAVRALLFGRRGRPLRRISPEVGRQLLQLTPTALSAARTAQMSTRPLVGEVRSALSRGWTLTEIGRESGLHPDRIRHKLERQTCAVLFGAQLRAGLAALTEFDGSMVEPEAAGRAA